MIFKIEEKDELHDKIALTQKALIQLQSEMDKNRGNLREHIPLKRQFDNQKTQLDKYLNSLFNLGEDDILIPLISDLYAAH